jgi:hypothetical protein
LSPASSHDRLRLSNRPLPLPLFLRSRRTLPHDQLVKSKAHPQILPRGRHNHLPSPGHGSRLSRSRSRHRPKPPALLSLRRRRKSAVPPVRMSRKDQEYRTISAQGLGRPAMRPLLRSRPRLHRKRGLRILHLVLISHTTLRTRYPLPQPGLHPAHHRLPSPQLIPDGYQPTLNRNLHISTAHPHHQSQPGSNPPSPCPSSRNPNPNRLLLPT